MCSIPGGLPSRAKPRTRVALDSGAVAVEKSNIVIDIDAYIDFVLSVEHVVDFHVNLDVIGNGQASYENWEYMRSKGLDPMAVYHWGTPIAFCYKYIRQTDRIGIGGLRGLSNKKRLEILDWLWSNHLVDRTGYPRARIHGLGITAPALLDAFPWHSVDSSSWVQSGGKYGYCLIPKPNESGSGYSYDQSPIRVSVTTRSAHRPNHIDQLLTPQRHQVMKYIEERGFKLGKGDPGDDDFEQGLRNDGTMRDQLSAIFYVEMGQALGKPVYLAGGFTAIQDAKVEKRVQQTVFSLGSDYYRMISFADYPKIQTVLDLKRKELSYER